MKKLQILTQRPHPSFGVFIVLLFIDGVEATFFTINSSSKMMHRASLNKIYSSIGLASFSMGWGGEGGNEARVPDHTGSSSL